MADELLTPGRGRFYIKKVKSHDEYGLCLETKKGDRKVMMVIDVTDSNGKKGVVFEHLTMNIAWKVEAICKCVNMHHVFESDATCLDKLEDLEGCGGECIVGSSEATPEWPSKTIIAKYIVPKESKPKHPPIPADFDDSLPF